jgi:hypothetical protein
LAPSDVLQGFGWHKSDLLSKIAESGREWEEILWDCSGNAGDISVELHHVPDEMPLNAEALLVCDETS